MTTIYDTKIPRDHIGHLYTFSNLCKIGAAATDTTLSIDVRVDLADFFDVLPVYRGSDRYG